MAWLSVSFQTTLSNVTVVVGLKFRDFDLSGEKSINVTESFRIFRIHTTVHRSRLQMTLSRPRPLCETRQGVGDERSAYANHEQCVGLVHLGFVGEHQGVTHAFLVA